LFPEVEEAGGKRLLGEMRPFASATRLLSVTGAESQEERLPRKESQSILSKRDSCVCHLFPSLLGEAFKEVPLLYFGVRAI